MKLLGKMITLALLVAMISPVGAGVWSKPGSRSRRRLS